MQRIFIIYQKRSAKTSRSPLPPKPSVNSVKLSKVTLPGFHGDPKQRYSFWCVFEAAVDFQLIPDVQKLAYLQGCLNGIAKEVAARFPVHEENYDEIVKR